MPAGKTGVDLKRFEKIDWDSLTFANNYIFLEVMNNKKRCQYLIEKILHIPIKRILHIVAERHTGSPRISSKSIAPANTTIFKLLNKLLLQCFLFFRKSGYFGVESEIPLRTRYYQSLISMDMLRRGMNYPELRKSFVVFICTFDPYGKGLPVYHFTYRCKEDNALQMGDLTENIFLNAKAADNTEDEELAAFLRYVNSGLAQNAFTQEIDEETKRVRNDTKWRERIVTWEMDLRIIKKRAHEKGKQEGIQEGKALGKQEGITLGKQEIAEALRKKGMSEAEIAEVTGLPEKKETLK